jgi:hypothetical protein
MAAPRKKAPVKKKSRWWLIPKLFMLLGIGGLVAIIMALLVMEQELNRIGFFTRVKLPSFQLPNPIQKDNSEPTSNVPPSPSPTDQSIQRQEPAPQSTQVAGQIGRESTPTRTTEDISREDRRQLNDLTGRRPTEDLSHDDRKQLDNILRSR